MPTTDKIAASDWAKMITTKLRVIIDNFSMVFRKFKLEVFKEINFGKPPQPLFPPKADGVGKEGIFEDVFE